MYKITTEKMSGMISGIQHSENGEIEWSRDLPKTCLLSPSAQQLVTKLLAGLMECQPARMWSFDQFFESVTYILSHKVYHVFVVHSMRDVVMHLLPQESTNDLKMRLKSIFNTSLENQLLLWNNKEVTDIREVTTSEEKPILLLSSDVVKMKQSPILASVPPKFPDLRVSITNTDQDAQVAKLSSSMSYSVQRSVAKCVLYYNLARSTPVQVISFIQSNACLLFEKQQACYHFYNSLDTQFEYLMSTSTNLLRLGEELFHDKSCSHLEASTKEAQSRHSQLQGYWNVLSRKMVM